MLSYILNLIYPPACLVCGTKTDDEHLCQRCIEGIKKVNPAVNSIRYAGQNGTYYERLYSVALYEGVLKEAIRLFKYKGKLSLARTFSRMLIEFMEQNVDTGSIDLLIPVPLHNSRQHEREFNQAQLLAAPIATHFGIPLSTNSLRRIKQTPSQSNLRRNERLQNLKGAFLVKRPESIGKKKVLIIDDVFTTGATVNECAKALVSNGASGVSVFTLARSE